MNQVQYDKYFSQYFQVICYAFKPDSHEMVFMNDVFLRLLDMESGAYFGKKYEDIFSGEPPSIHLKSNLKQGEVHQSVADFFQWGKTFVWNETMIDTEEGRIRLGYAYETMETTEEMTQLRVSHALDQAVIRCAGALLDSGDIDSAIDSLLETVMNYYNAERAYIYEVDLDSETVSNSYERCRLGTKGKIQNLQDISLESVPQWFKYFENNQFISLNRQRDQISDQSPEGILLSQQEVDCLLIVPIKKGEILTGFIGVNNSEQMCDNPKLLMTVSTFIHNDMEKRSVGMELCSTVNEYQTALDMSEMMFHCAKILLNDEGAELAITHLLEAVCRYLGADSAYIFEYQKKERLLKNSYYYSNLGTSLKNQQSRSVLNQIHLSPNLVCSADDFFKNDFIPLRNRNKIEEKDSWEYQIFTVLNCDTCIMAPFHKNRNFFGILGIDNPKTNIDHKEVITTVASFIVNTLEKRGMMNQLEYLSYSDELTGLKNRNGYLQKMKEFRRQDLENFAVIYGDINELKMVNDTLGHEVGDKLILWCVRFLQSQLRDPIYRIGGDEFICFLSGISEASFQQRMGQLNTVQARMAYVNLTFVSAWSEEVDDIDDKIFLADQLMYEEKERLHKINREKNLSEREKREEITARMKEILRN